MDADAASRIKGTGSSITDRFARAEPPGPVATTEKPIVIGEEVELGDTDTVSVAPPDMLWIVVRPCTPSVIDVNAYDVASDADAER